MKEIKTLDEFIPYVQAMDIDELGCKFQPFGYYSLSYHQYPIDKYGVCTTVNVGDFMDIDQFKYVECLFGDKSKSIKAITYHQAFKYFRKKHKITHSIKWLDSVFGYYYTITDMDTNTDSNDSKGFSKYEEAELSCIQKLIEMVKEKNKEIHAHNGQL